MFVPGSWALPGQRLVIELIVKIEIVANKDWTIQNFGVWRTALIKIVENMKWDKENPTCSGKITVREFFKFLEFEFVDIPSRRDKA